ncbi:MAG TPA: ATP-binding protein, partial [bacterium]|nr:ATP-binding protein [bacterium]
MPSLLYAPDPVAVFRGLSPVPGELEVEVVVHDGSVTLPSFGEFLLIQMSEVEAAVGRVTHCRPCGPVSSPQGENYLAELGKAGAAMPDRVRQLILRFTLRLQLLGRLKVKDGRLVFEVGLRSLAQVGAPVCRPTAAALRELCNVRLDDPNTDGLPRYKAPFGHLALGDVVNEQVEIQFDINRLKERRSFVFARAGYGKSNLMKYLIAQLYRSDPKVGLLIIDPEGEYALPSAQVPGLASLPGLRGKLRYYSQRPAPPDFTDCYAGSVFLNFKHFTGREIVTAFTPSEKQLMVWANWVKSAKPKEWAALVNLFARKDWTPMAKDVREALGKPPTDRKEDVVADAVVNNLAHVVSLIHREESTIASTLLEDLQEGRIVIVDTSAISSESARAITELLLVKVFQHNVNTFTDERRGKPVPTIAVFEEAQTTLGHHHFSENSIFVRWVKEGRKYGLGSIMITQQPGAISDQILSQGDNFFVMHLLNQGDLEALQRVNAHYGPDILRQLRSEPIKGNCYFWSAPDQPYVISARVHNFDK